MRRAQRPCGVAIPVKSRQRLVGYLLGQGLVGRTLCNCRGGAMTRGATEHHKVEQGVRSPSRFAPWTETHAASPIACRPGTTRSVSSGVGLSTSV